jgi:hypothetical protein
MAERPSTGEGNKEADRRYRERTQEFVEQGKVEEAARAAAPESEDEAEAMRLAEDRAKARTAEKDPAVDRDYRKPGSH